MRSIFLTIALLLTGIVSGQFITLNQDEEVLLSAWLDPTLEDPGAHIGAELTKELLGGWVSIGLSHYGALEPSYTDLVISGGVGLHFFNYQDGKFYLGGRGGPLFRGDNLHALLGLVAGFDILIYIFDQPLRVGARYWFDYRTDQAYQFYGDSDAFDPGPLGIKDPMMQENGAIVVTFLL